MQKKAYFAGGCFWCVEHDLRAVPGVIDVFSGYSGTGANPSYENHRGFAESVEVLYDENITSFKKLAQFFLDHVDPTDNGGQFHDRGESYQTAIYYQNDEEKSVAEALVKELDDSSLYDKPIAVRILLNLPFYKAEEYHQRYAEKNPEHYQAYSEGSGRKAMQAKVCEIREQKSLEWKD